MNCGAVPDESNFMAFSLNLKVKNASALAVASLWDEVSAFEDVASMRALNYSPHFTFAIYDTDGVSEQQARDAIERAADGEAESRITFNRIRTFAGLPLILWAAPEPQEALARMHQTIHATIDPMLCRPYYRPELWTPHCTLGTRIREERRDDAVAFAESFRGGVEAIFDVIDCMAFPPLRLIAEQRLSPGA
jgi:2'-5' RNA ligase